MASEERKGLWRKLFEKRVWMQDETLRVLQDRIVLGANLWAALVKAVLCAVVVCIPEIALYWGTMDSWLLTTEILKYASFMMRCA